MNYLFKRSSTPNKRPDPAAMTPGEVLMNNSEESPGLFFKNANNSLVVAAPPYVGVTAPNSSPAGSTGNSPGEFWIDTSDPLKAQLKIYTGSSWSLSYGNPIQGFTDFANKTSYIGVTIPTPPTGTDNTAIGFDSGKSLTTGASNTLLGSLAGSTISTNSNCVGIGYQSLGGATSAPKLGDFAVSVGDYSMAEATQFDLCTAVGANALRKNRGVGNTAMGANALAANLTGEYNIAVGVNALSANTTGSNNIAIGGEAMNAVNGCSDNVCIGSFAGATLRSGSNGNLIIGQGAGPNRDATGTFTNNVFIGKETGTGLFAGSGNTLIGVSCLSGPTNPPLDYAINNTVILGTLDVFNARNLSTSTIDGEIWICVEGKIGLRLNKSGALSIGPNNFGQPGAPLIQQGVGATATTSWFNDGPQSTFTSADNKRITIKYGLVSEITQL